MAELDGFSPSSSSERYVITDIHDNKTLYPIDPTVETTHSASVNIMAYDHPNGTTFFKYDAKALAKRVYDKTAIVAQGALTNHQALLM